MLQSSADSTMAVEEDDQCTSADAFVATPSRFVKWIKRLCLALVVFVLLLAGGIALLVYLATHEPDFYRSALEIDTKLQQENGSQMETQILNLRNSVLSDLDWSAIFTEEQINGWFAWDLRKKFPNLIPPEVSDPRVLLDEKTITLAFRCSVKPLKGVVVIKADIFLTGVINQIGIRIKSIHCGLLPIPVATIAEQISKQAERAGFELDWDEEQGDSVAMINLPDSLIKPNDGGSYIELKNLQVQDGSVAIGGKTHPPDF